MREFFEAIGWFFEEILFWPMDLLRALELESWWLANLITWIFIIISIVATWYWLKQMKMFKDNNEDEQDTTAHSFLS